MPVAFATYNPPPGPCEVYECPCFQDCAESRAACRAFQQYQKTGRVTQPTEIDRATRSHGLYKRIMATVG